MFLKDKLSNFLNSYWQSGACIYCKRKIGHLSDCPVPLVKMMKKDRENLVETIDELLSPSQENDQWKTSKNTKGIS